MLQWVALVGLLPCTGYQTSFPLSFTPDDELDLPRGGSRAGNASAMGNVHFDNVDVLPSQ